MPMPMGIIMLCFIICTAPALRPSGGWCEQPDPPPVQFFLYQFKLCGAALLLIGLTVLLRLWFVHMSGMLTIFGLYDS